MLIRTKNILMVLCTVILMLPVLAGCSDLPQQQEEPELPTVVYDDGVYIIEAASPTVTVAEDGTTQTDIRLIITNRSLDKLVISSVLGLRVTSAGTECRLRTPDGLVPVDGIIMPDETKEGCVSLVTDTEPQEYKIELAVDYLGDQWISFVVSR